MDRVLWTPPLPSNPQAQRWWLHTAWGGTVEPTPAGAFTAPPIRSQSQSSPSQQAGPCRLYDRRRNAGGSKAPRLQADSTGGVSSRRGGGSFGGPQSSRKRHNGSRVCCVSLRLRVIDTWIVVPSSISSGLEAIDYRGSRARSLPQILTRFHGAGAGGGKAPVC